MATRRHIYCKGSYLAAVCLGMHNAVCMASSFPSWICKAPSDYSDAQLLVLIEQNCDRVNQSLNSVEQAVTDVNYLADSHRDLWLQKQNDSRTLCAEAEAVRAAVQSSLASFSVPEDASSYRASLLQAADQAVNAWGSVIMEGRQCCVSVDKGLCESSYRSTAGLITLVLLGTVIGSVALSSAFAACRPPVYVREPKALQEAGEAVSKQEELAEGIATGAEQLSGAVAVGAASASSTAHTTASPRTAHLRDALRASLQEAWLQGNCLRVLRGAHTFASSSASLFSSLWCQFGFQKDNVRNQHEHLLSLWRSHCALVADRQADSDMPVRRGDLEEQLLGMALPDLHADLMDGFISWRAKLYKELPMSMPKFGEVELPLLGGSQWQQITGTPCGSATSPEAAREMSVQLAEIATYLLVWGEAGNLRFMPELVYFITELALSADHSAASICEMVLEATDRTVHQSRPFLAKIIRPIYNVVFDEWYEDVAVENDKDKKKIRRGFEAFLPSDAANYDDWDELFCDSERLARSLQLTDRTKLFDLPHCQRFAALPRVDWQASLSSVKTKTHREIHSLWGVFASTHRVWLLHVVLFLCSVCLVAKHPAPVHQQNRWGRLAAVGLAMPIHAMLWIFARWQVTGRAFRVRRFRALYMGRNSCMPVCWMLPMVTYTILRWVDADVSSPWYCVVLVMHYLLSAIAFVMLVFKPGNEELLWTPTVVPIYRRVIRYGFWCCILLVKFTLGLISVTVMHDAVEGLDLTKAGHESPRDLTNVFSSMSWASNPFLWCLMWATSFLLYIADTHLWFVIGCTIMGVTIVFSQRHWQCGKFVVEDAISKIPERFSRKVLSYAPAPKSFKADHQLKRFSPCFPLVWDRIVEHLRYEDNINNELMGDLTFTAIGTYHNVTWADLKKPLGHTGASANVSKQTEKQLCRSGCGRRAQLGLARNGLPHTHCCIACELCPGEHDQNCIDGATDDQQEPLPEVEKIAPLAAVGEAIAAVMRSLFPSDEKADTADANSKTSSGKTLAGGTPSPISASPRSSKRSSKRRVTLAEETPGSKGAMTERSGRSPALAERRVHVPEIFRPRGACEIFFRHYFNVTDPHWPQSPDLQWRIIALARGLGLPMPRPFRAPYFPGLTVLIPHYGETILMKKNELFPETAKGSQIVPLIDWVKYHWVEEFSSFTSRMQSGRAGLGWPLAGSQWNEYSEEHWDKLGVWSSMRMQTLWRTVAGMCLYHSALQCHYEAQVERGDDMSKLAHESVWDPSDCFTCLVSMQMYKYFDQTQLNQTNRMFNKFPDCLKIAFIDCEDKGEMSNTDFVHARQSRRYFSCLIDKCSADRDGRRLPRFRIELPGYPILGDGKGDNQNHAIPFMRGSFAQCIDANQGAYFEQMLLLPCVLGQFRSQKPGDGGGKRIIGLPEHITSDLGSVGDIAASAETAFGTILQRTYAALGARMHYGHPDIMNKACMMQQGGVSKATKTLNLSEDIFAGMDFTLRGQGREIQHCEYFHLTKGRDLGFNAVLGFFSKLSSGAGEQILTRQMFRLGQIFHLPEFLTFYYAHVGYYFTQFFMSWSLPVLVLVWLVVLLSDCDSSFEVFQTCGATPAAEMIAKALSVWLSWLLFIFLIATSMPFFAELWMERSFKTAIIRLLKQFCTCSALLFIFQSKVIGHYVVNELLVGGATYVATGRSLPTERRPFIGQTAQRYEGLYLDYAKVAYYDGAQLLASALLVVAAGGMADAGEYSRQLIWMWVALALQIVSWLLAPFIFNPYQFVYKEYIRDLRSWWAFFTEEGGKHWQHWYEKTELKIKGGCRSSFSIVFILTCFFLLTWHWTVMLKVEALASIYSKSDMVAAMRVLTLLPPIASSLVYCMFASCFSEDESIPDERDLERGRLPKACIKEVPLGMSALAVLILDAFEATFILYSFYSVGWLKAFAAGMILKYSVLSCCVNLAEDATRLQCFNENGRLGKILVIWVRAHRMCRDLLTSSLILLALVPLVMLTSLNSSACPGCSAHNLLLYRDPGHFRRAEVRVYKDTTRSRSFFSRSEITERASRCCGRLVDFLKELVRGGTCCRASAKWAGGDTPSHPASSPDTLNQLPISSI